MTGPSVLEYARHHRLSLPPTDSDLSKYIQHLSYARVDEDTVPDFDFPSKEAPISHLRLQTSHEAAGHLAEMVKPPEAIPWEYVLTNPFWRQELRMETPLLVSDHAKDMRWFKQPLNLKRVIQELADDCDMSTPTKNDDSAFLKQCRQAAETANLNTHQPRLDITDAVLALLARSTDDQSAQVNFEEVYETCFQGSKRAQLELLTPSLTPPMPPTKPGLSPGVADWSLESRSDQEIPYENLMTHFEQQMEDSDQICTSDVSNGSPIKVRQILAKATSAPKALIVPHLQDSSPPGHQKGTQRRTDVSSLKLQEPLIDLPYSEPQDVDETRDALDDLFNDFLEFPVLPDEDDGQNSKQEALQHQLDECQSHVTTIIIQEQPVMNEALLRVTVPDMPEALIGRLDSLSLLTMAEDQRISSYHINSNEEARLNWVPFSARLMRPDLREELQPSNDNMNFIAAPDKVTQSGDLLWKEPGLRLLDSGSECDDEWILDHAPVHVLDEIATELAASKTLAQKKAPSDIRDDILATSLGELARQPSASRGVSAPVYHRRDSHGQRSIVSGKDSIASDDSASIPSPVDDRPLKRPRLEISGETGIPFGKTKVPTFDTGPARFSASGSLASFLDLRGKKFKRRLPPGDDHATDCTTTADSPTVSEDPIGSSQYSLRTGQPALLAGLSPVSSAKDKTVDLLESPQRPIVDPSQDIQVPSTPKASRTSGFSVTPPAAAITDPRVIVLDESLVRNRSLMSLLDQHYEEPLQAVYRNLHNSVDIILNPTTDLILTNLQALKQRSLPGQISPASLTLQDRIRASTAQYGTIFILISSTSLTLDSSAELITNFTAFCAALKSTGGTAVCPVWLPVSPPPLNRPCIDPVTAWAWHLIAQHSLSLRGDMSFIDDMTLWELFLREAGMNAMAAQSMLGMLKRGAALPTIVSDGDVVMRAGENIGGSATAAGAWGLRRLIAMSVQQRMDMFGRFLGEKCLARLNEALDGKLVST